MNYGILGEQEILIGLSGVSLVRILSNQHPAVEHSPRVPAKNAFIELPARASLPRMFDSGVNVHNLTAGGGITRQLTCPISIPTAR